MSQGSHRKRSCQQERKGLNKNSISGALEGPDAPRVCASEQYPVPCEGTEEEMSAGKEEDQQDLHPGANCRPCCILCLCPTNSTLPLVRTQKMKNLAGRKEEEVEGVWP